MNRILCDNVTKTTFTLNHYFRKITLVNEALEIERITEKITIKPN